MNIFDRNRPSSVRRAILTPIVILSILLIGLAALISVEGVNKYRSAATLQSLDAGANQFVAGAFELLMERLATNTALQAEGPIDAETLKEIQTRRAKGRESLTPGLAHLERAEFANKPALLAKLKTALSEVATIQREADQAVTLPRAQRNEALRRNFVPTVTALVDAATDVWFAALHSSAAPDAELSRLAAYKELGFRLRDFAGRERSHIAQAISLGAPIAPDKLALIEVSRAQVQTLLELVESLVADPTTSKRVLAAIEDGRRGYGQFRTLADQARQASSAGTPYAFTASSWASTTTPLIGKFLDILHAAGQASEQHIGKVKEKAVYELGLSLALMASALALSFYAVFVLLKRVTRPLGHLTGAIGRLAEGDTETVVPAVTTRDEIGVMTDALTVLRQAAIEKLQLQVQAAEQRRLADEDRARNDAVREAAAKEQAFAVNAVGEGLEHMASGDLTFRLTGEFAAEYGKLREDFNAAMEQLQGTVTTIIASTAAIRSGSGEISEASDDLSRRTEQQAASLEETAAALDEITAAVRRTSGGADHARQVVTTTKEDAERSSEVVHGAVQAMAEIETSAKQISQIIGVIDEIAFQTNLLALNAGVEAARAGEAGRGFAVVASEVRALAQRSADAAKEIKTLISASSQQVAAGVDLVGQAGGALGRITAQVADLNAVVVEIAASTKEQATGLAEVNTAVNQMDQVTQQNAAMVEQSTAASHALSQEANELGRIVGRFQVGDRVPGVKTAGKGPAPVVRIVPDLKSKPKPHNRTVTALKSTGGRGASAQRRPEPAPAPAEEGWEEF